MSTKAYQLDNGLSVIVRRLHTAPVVSISVWVQTGAADETPSEAGLAHMHEHMLFKGTTRRGVGEIAQEIEGHGGDINAFTSHDNTVFHVTMSSRYFDVGLDVLADAVIHSTFDAEELEREREVILEELRESEDLPSTRAAHVLFGLAFGDGGYARPVIGTREAVAGHGREALRAFFHKWYRPDNMVVVVVGDVGDDAETAIEATFGSMLAGPSAPTRLPAEALPQGLRAQVETTDTTDVFVRLGFNIPAANHRDIPALDFVGALLGYGESSRLVESLERDKEWVNSVSVSGFVARQPGLLVVAADYQQEGEHPGALALIEECVRECFLVGLERVGTEEFERVRTLVASREVYRRETVDGQGMVLGACQAVMGRWQFETEFYDALRELTPDAVATVARRYLRLDNLSLVVCGPTDAVGGLGDEDLLKAARRGADQASAAPRSTERRGDAPRVVRTRLDNGLVLIVEPDSTLDLVAVRAVFPGGLRSEPLDRAGVSSMVSNLWARGNDAWDGDEITRQLERAGAALFGLSGRNSLGLQLDSLSSNLDRTLPLFTQSLARPAMADDELAVEKRLVLESMAARSDDLSTVAGILFNRAIFDGHPYAHPIDGSTDSVHAIERSDVEAYHRWHVQPQKAVMAVVGDVNVDDVRRQIEAALGGSERWPQLPALTDPQWLAAAEGLSVPALTRSIYHTATMAKEQAFVVVGFRGLRISDPDRHALDVLLGILSGQGGRLFVELRDRRSLAYSVHVQAVGGIEMGSVAMMMSTRPDKLEEAVSSLWAEAMGLRDRAVEEAELERARRFLIGSRDIDRQLRGARAIEMALDELFGLGYEAWLHEDAKLNALSTDDLVRVARRVLTPDRAVLLIVRPPGIDAPDFARLGFGVPLERPLP